MYGKFSSGMKIYKDTADGDIILKVTKVLPVFPDGWRRPVMIINGDQFDGVESTQTDGGILGT